MLKVSLNIFKNDLDMFKIFLIIYSGALNKINFILIYLLRIYAKI